MNNLNEMRKLAGLPVSEAMSASNEAALKDLLSLLSKNIKIAEASFGERDSAKLSQALCVIVKGSDIIKKRFG